MGREIERKYLVRDDRWRAEAGQGLVYRQGYLSFDPERSVRVRTIGHDRAFLTIKGKSEGAGRDEFEYAIPIQDARHLLDKLCVPPLIEKTRYIIKHDPLKWEIDEFGGENRGLVVAEVELEDDRQEISKPDWLGDEVTEDSRYFNLSLVRHPYSKWGQH